VEETQETPLVEDPKTSPDTKDTEVAPMQVEPVVPEEENEANGLDFDEME
jgi:hypothetical protein